MTVQVAINGFSRIGRNELRAIAESRRKDIEVVGINDLGPVETNAHSLRWSSLRDPVKGNSGTNAAAASNPSTFSWQDLGVDIALECTGIFIAKNRASKCGDCQQLKNILGYTNGPNVSDEVDHFPHSQAFHMDQTKVIGGTLMRIRFRYDNEWGFSNRMADTALNELVGSMVAAGRDNLAADESAGTIKMHVDACGSGHRTRRAAQPGASNDNATVHTTFG
jgi:glyceraldehyde-3-phosphate dehydrogenase/erythrose-4-phosphate dehydrogenase